MKKDVLRLTLIFVVLSMAFFVYAKLSKTGMESVYKSWDGPSYVIAAKSLYVPALAVQYNSIHSPEIRANFTFLPAHFPLYPLLIRAFSFAGYYQAMLAISLIFSLLTILGFYFLARQIGLTHPFLVTLPLVLLPPRWFIIAHTGSSEPLFLFFLILSLLFYFRHNPVRSALMASLTLLARPQGTLLGVAYLLFATIDFCRTKDFKYCVKTYLAYLLIPTTLGLIFTFYKLQTGDFWAFFSAISIFHHFHLSLFPTFNFGAENIETFWQEANALYYILYLYAIFELFHTKKWQLGVLGIVFYVPLIFLQHSDISRYSLPLLPLACIALAPIISRKSFTWTVFLLIPAIFLYATNFILYNRAP